MSKSAPAKASRLARIFGNDLVYSLLRAPAALTAVTFLIVVLFVAIFAPLIAPFNPYDLASFNLLDSSLPPSWYPQGQAEYLLGTDNQGRDLFSAIIYGARISLFVGVASVLFSVVFGIIVGLIAGYVGGIADVVLMRIADAQLAFPTLLIALLINGIISTILPYELRMRFDLVVIIFAIGISNWPQFARTVRGSTLAEREREYVLAAQIVRIPTGRILFTHILPNVISPVLVIGTLTLGHAILAEATLSFLGIGLPATQPSLGTLISTGNQYVFSGYWWIMVFPGAALVALVLCINVAGDWLRDILNPKLR